MFPAHRPLRIKIKIQQLENATKGRHKTIDYAKRFEDKIQENPRGENQEEPEEEEEGRGTYARNKRRAG